MLPALSAVGFYEAWHVVGGSLWIPGSQWDQQETPLGPSGLTNFDSPPHFTPTLGGPDPLGAVAPHPNGQKSHGGAPQNPKLEIYGTLEGSGVLPALSAVGFYEA